MSLKYLEMKKEETTKFKLEQLSSSLKNSKLESGLPHQFSLFFGSFSSAIGFFGVVCGCLATVIISHPVMEPETAEPLIPITIHRVEPFESPPSKQRTRKPFLRTPSTPVSPSRKSVKIVSPLSDFVDIPDVPNTELSPIDSLDFEELEFDNPFASKSTKNTATQKKKTTAKSSQTSQQDKARKLAAQKKRQAALAKKIVRGASIISRASPVYPKSAQRKNIQGRVVVTVTIDTNGQVSSSFVDRSSGNAALDASALKAARKFRFRPALNGLGKSITVKKKIPFDFHLQ